MNEWENEVKRISKIKSLLKKVKEIEKVCKNNGWDENKFMNDLKIYGKELWEIDNYW